MKQTNSPDRTDPHGRRGCIVQAANGLFVLYVVVAGVLSARDGNWWGALAALAVLVLWALLAVLVRWLDATTIRRGGQ